MANFFKRGQDPKDGTTVQTQKTSGASKDTEGVPPAQQKLPDVSFDAIFHDIRASQQQTFQGLQQHEGHLSSLDTRIYTQEQTLQTITNFVTSGGLVTQIREAILPLVQTQGMQEEISSVANVLKELERSLERFVQKNDMSLKALETDIQKTQKQTQTISKRIENIPTSENLIGQ